jgi:hypothetical protein
MANREKTVRILPRKESFMGYAVIDYEEDVMTEEESIVGKYACHPKASAEQIERFAKMQPWLYTCL